MLATSFHPTLGQSLTVQLRDKGDIEDTTLESNRNSPSGGDAILQGGPGKTILIQVPVPDSPDGQRRMVGSASLRLMVSRGNAKLLACRRVVKPWAEGPMRAVGQPDPSARWGATWTQRRTGLDPVNWQLPGARGNEDTERISGVTASIDGDYLLLEGLGPTFEDMRKRPWANNGISLEFSEPVEFQSTEAAKNGPSFTFTFHDPEKLPEDGADLQVVSIARSPELPRIDVQNSNETGVYLPGEPQNPNDKFWPVDGETVTWTATVRNAGKAPAQGFDAVWTVRDKQTTAVSIAEALAPGESKTLKLEVPFKLDIFDHRRQPISLRLFPKSPDNDPANDVLEVQENGLQFGVVLPKDLPIPNAYIWVQRMFSKWNESLARHSKYSFAPDGCKERVFVEQFFDAQPSASAAKLLDGVITVDPSWFVKSPQEAERQMLRQITLNLGLVDLAFPADMPDADDPWPGIVGGDTRNDAPFPGAYALPFETGFDVVLNSYDLTRSGWRLSATDVGALNGRVGRRRGYTGDYLFDVPPIMAVGASDWMGRPLKSVELTFVPIVDGKLAYAKQFAMTTSETGGVILNSKPVGEHKPTMNASQLKDNFFGLIDVTGRTPGYRVEVTVNGVKAASYLKVWQAVESFYRGQRLAGFAALRFNVPWKPLKGGNIVPPQAEPYLDGDTDTYQPLGSLDIDLGKDQVIGGIRLKAKSLDGLVVETLSHGEGAKPVLFYKEQAPAWTLKARVDSEGWITLYGFASGVRTLRVRSSGAMISEIQVLGAQATP